MAGWAIIGSCPRCKGQLLSDDEGAKCFQCGHIYYKPMHYDPEPEKAVRVHTPGVCNKCEHSKDPDDGYRLCLPCREYNAQKNRALEERARRLNLCIKCRRRETMNGKDKCPRCLDRAERTSYSYGG